jgi:hypothetical protein
MVMAQGRLCIVCQKFDVRTLLLAAEAAPIQADIDPFGLTRSAKRAPVYDAQTHFFQQHANLAMLKVSAGHCDLCEAIWAQFIRDCKDTELSKLDEAFLAQGLGKEPIYIGTLE